MRRGTFLTGIGTSLADDLRNVFGMAARPDSS